VLSDVKIYASHHLPCTPETFWRLYFDDAYREALDREIGLAEHVILSDEPRGDKRFIRARLTPRREVPRAVQKMVKSATLGYVEERLYDADRSRIDWTALHGALGRRFHCQGLFRVEREGDGSRRVLEGEIRVSILGVGKLIEKTIASDVEGTYDVSARFIARWLEDHPQ
jgi:Protein of unknown function (DUF2505)